MSLVYDRVEKSIREANLLSAGERVVVGVSGGSDSLCLLDCLVHLGYEVVLAHLDHGLREASAEDAAYVRQVARDYPVPCVIVREDVGASVEKGGSVEEAARRLRYRFLAGVAQERAARRIAVGHTADDQVETILMHFLRGAGPSGLSGMAPATPLSDWVGIPASKGLTLIRPLLELTHRQTESHCSAIGVEPRFDRSNEDLRFTRNRLRHELLPTLVTYNPGIRRVILRTGRTMAALVELLDGLVRDLWDDVVREAGVGALAINAAEFNARPLALRQAMVRKGIWRLRPDLRDIGFEAVERAVQFIRAQSGVRQVALPGGLELLRVGEEVVIREPGAHIQFPWYPQLTADRSLPLQAGGFVGLDNGWRLEVQTLPLDPSARGELAFDDSGNTAVVDAAGLDRPFILRPLQPGDRIRPLGMDGSIKVSELFINLGIPAPARARWPLVVTGAKVAWVVGLRMAEDFKLTERSEQAVVFRLIRAERAKR